ncbi:MAG: transposase [Verrucomicrobiales bacterium]
MKLLPAEKLGEHFHDWMGRPSKELYAMCGLLLLAEFRDWTIDQAASAWGLDAGVQYALNLPRDRQYLCARTLDTYRQLLRENEAAQGIFEEVTAALVKELGVEIKKQRLDSTHVLSNMATFGRLKLLAVTTKRFLIQLKRHHREEYEALPEELRARYTAAESRIFGFGTKNPEPREEALQTVGEDMVVLLERFAQAEAITSRSSYQALDRVFKEHCEVGARGRMKLREKALDENGQSSRTLQNPSDEGAGYSGHKGAGYQVQLAQACGQEEEGPGLIVACVPQSAAESDSGAVQSVIEQQQRMGTLPEEQLADTAYGSESNVDLCASVNVTLIAPVPGRAAAAKTKENSVKEGAKAPATWAEKRRAEQESKE